MNFSSDNRLVFSCPYYPTFLWDLTDKVFPWIMVAIVSIASPAAVILNILVIAAVRSRKELQKNPNILLSSMAVADILVGAINMPLSATVDFVISRQVFDDRICLVDLLNVYLMHALTTCTLYHLILIAWERNQAIRNCYEHKVKMTRSRLKKLAITAWFLAALTPIPGIVVTVQGINYDFIIEAISAFFLLILICLILYFYLMVYRETRKSRLITQVTVLVKTKLENRVAMTCALASAAVIPSVVPIATVGLLGDLYPGFRKSSVFRSAETLLQMNSIVNPLIYFYRNSRFRSIILEILRIRKPPAAESKVDPMQYVRSKDLSSAEGTQKQRNAYSRRLFSRSASCELANVTLLNCAMKKRSVSAPSLIRSHSNSFDSFEPQNPSSILTVVATVHPQRLEGHFSIIRLSSSKNSTKGWEAKRNSFNLSGPPEDLKKEQFPSNYKKLNKRLKKSATFISGAEGLCAVPSRSRKGLLKRSMSAPSLGEHDQKFLQWCTAVARSRRCRPGQFTSFKKTWKIFGRIFMKALSWENMKSYHRPQWTPLIWDSHGSEFTSAALAIAILKQVVACSKLQDRKEIGSKKVARKRAGAGGSRSSGACKNCFQYLIPVYQLLVYPMIGQQNVTKNTVTTRRKKKENAAIWWETRS